MLGRFEVGSVSEGRFGTRKCTVIGAWAGTQRGLSRGFYTVCAGMNARENYAGMSSGKITRKRNIGRQYISCQVRFINKDFQQRKKTIAKNSKEH